MTLVFGSIYAHFYYFIKYMLPPTMNTSLWSLKLGPIERNLGENLLEVEHAYIDKCPPLTEN